MEQIIFGKVASPDICKPRHSQFRNRFEAFDEPWKIVFNSGVQNWEDKWGLMDPARNLKPGLKIPDCNGQTVGP